MSLSFTLSPTSPDGNGEATLELIRLLVFLLGVSALVTVLARRINLPYTVALVALGLVAGAVDGQSRIEVTPQLVLVVLLPALIFEASLRTDLVRLRSSLVGVGLLAGPGVLISASTIAVALSVGAGLPWTEAFVVGAMLSATDPAAVIATFRRLKSPRRLSTVVEAESVFNDGTGIVVFALAVDFTTRPLSAPEAAISFVSAVVVSTVLGVGAGYAASRLLPLIGDHLIEITISVVLAYGTYLLADALGQSGVIATATAGIVLGNYGRGHGMSEVTEEALLTIWDFLAYLATAFVFLLVGLAIATQSLASMAVAIGWAIVASLVGRALIVYVMLGSWRVARETLAARGRRRLRKAASGAAGVETAAAEVVGSVVFPNPMPVQWLHVLWWSGLRGAVSTALALSLPSDFPDRGDLQAVVFGVVLFTLLVQATTAEWVVGRWGVADRNWRAVPQGSADGTRETGDGQPGRPAEDATPQAETTSPRPAVDPTSASPLRRRSNRERDG